MPNGEEKRGEPAKAISEPSAVSSSSAVTDSAIIRRDKVEVEAASRDLSRDTLSSSQVNASSALSSGVRSAGILSTGMLSTMPLGTLLPELGELSHLYQIRHELKEKYKSVHAESASAASEPAKERLAEESMLNQLLQWLSLGLNEGR